jgi:hypothetical protein
MIANWVLMPVMTAWAWPLSWAVVAAACVWWLWPRAVRAEREASEAGEAIGVRVHRGPAGLVACVAVLVALLAGWPDGGWSGYAGLALQSPSVLTLTWAVGCCLQAIGCCKPALGNARVPALAWYLLCALGWLLTLDTLNLWPRAWEVNVYAWGFSVASLWSSAGLLWILAWCRHGAWVWQSISVLALYAVLRWPSGNLWDAWLDPGVWIVAHVQMLRHVWHSTKALSRR